MSPGARLAVLLSAAAAAAAALLAPVARAEGVRLPFAFTDCAESPLGGAELLSALRLESARLLSDSAVRIVEVRYHCDGHAQVRIDTLDEVILRDLFVQDAPLSERTRALALALAELTRGLQRPDPPVPQAPHRPLDDEPSLDDESSLDDETPHDDDTSPSRRRSSPKNALVGLALRAPLGSPTPLFGATAAHRWQRWSAGGSLLGARRDADASRRLLGSVTALMVGAQVGYRIGELILTPVHLELELVAGAGVVHVSGSAHGAVIARDVYKPYGEAHLSVLLRLATEEAIAPFLSLDGGRSSGVVAEAAGREVLRTGGWFAGIALGLNY